MAMPQAPRAWQGKFILGLWGEKTEVRQHRMLALFPLLLFPHPLHPTPLTISPLAKYLPPYPTHVLAHAQEELKKFRADASHLQILYNLGWVARSFKLPGSWTKAGC